ncbi:MAG: hypothetical protein ACE5FL_04110 [Myxococcota bacterium]
MMFEPRKFRRPWRAFAPVLVAFAALLAAAPAAAQPAFDVTVYHSLDEVGADPRAPGVPAGCVSAASTGTGDVFIWDPGSRGAGLEGDLAAMGNTVSRSTVLPADLSPFDVIWAIGFNTWTAAEISRVTAFIAAGGGAHLTGEHSGFDTTVNPSVQAVINALIVPTHTVTVGGQGNPAAPYDFNPAAIGGITTTPNLLTTWAPAATGGLALTPDDLDAFDNVLVFGVGAEGVAVSVGGVAGPADMQSGVGRFTVLMDVDWLSSTARIPIVQNLQTFLIGGAGGSTLDCVIQGGPNEQLQIWIDGGPTGCGSGETVCMLGAAGGSGDEICGADIVFQLSGVGKFSRFDPAGSMGGALVFKPDCTVNIETGQCLLPPGTTQVRMNFLRGLASPGTGPQRLGTLVVDSTGLVEGTSMMVTAFGEVAGANLQLRPHASAESPEVIAFFPVPEPGAVAQIVSGLVGLGMLQRMRRRCGRG